MRVTVCEMHDDPSAFKRDWARLVAHARTERTDLVLLPEMPFGRWFAVSSTYDAAIWRQAVKTHEQWHRRLVELAPSVIATRPVERGNQRFNEAFAWDARGTRAAHVKAFLPHEAGFFESSWYHAGDGTFEVIEVGDARVGVQICTEMWSLGHAQRYGKQGAQVIAIPRATSKNSVEKWVAGGRAAAIVSGAYTLSSNRTSPDDGPDFGGGGWVIDPDGQVLAVTSTAEPIRTVEIDLSIADRAKETYPRYALE